MPAMSPRRLLGRLFVSAPGLVILALLACGDSTAGTSDASTGGPGTGTGEPTGGPERADPCDPALPPIPEAEWPDRYASTICQLKSDCGCSFPGSCALDFVDGFELIRDDGANLGLVYDGDCAARKLAGLVQARACDKASAIDVNPSCTLDCLVYRGAVATGGACTSSPVPLTTLFADLCAAPNLCSADLCAAPIPTVDAGQPCVTPIARCKANAGCDVAGSKTCEPIVGEGKDCTGNGVCRPDLYCGGDGKCTPRGQVDAACTDDGECASFRCIDNKCDDWVWICEVAEELDLFGRHPSDF